MRLRPGRWGWCLWIALVAWSLPHAVARGQGALIATLPSGGLSPTSLASEHVAVRIDRQHASTVLEQRHLSRAEAPVEGVFRLRVGAGVRVDGFAYWDGDRKIVGRMFERAGARSAYAEARERRRDEALLEQTGEGEFSFRISRIEPREQKRIEVKTSLFLRRTGDVVEYRFPIARPDARIEVTVEDDRLLRSFASSTHELAVSGPAAGPWSIRATAPRGAPREFVLRYRVVEPPWTLSARVHRDRGRDAYVALTIATPPDMPDEAVAPKDVTVVLDRSRSMAGRPLAEAQAAAVDIVRRLRPLDRVNVIAFDATADALYAEPRDATPEIREEVIRFVEALRTGTGTDLATALEVALESQHRDLRPGVVLFLTDGRSHAQAALDVARRDAADTRVFTIGVGRAVERPLLARLAALERGRFIFVESASVLEERITSLYQQIEAPVLVGLELSARGGRLSGRYPRTLPDLCRDDELLVTSRVEGAGPLRIVLRGRYRGDPVEHEVVVPIPREVHAPWVGREWAGARVDDLLEEIALNGEHRELLDEVVELAVAYDLVTPHTAFLAVPEGELEDAGPIFGAALARRRRVLAARPDAAALGGVDMPDADQGDDAASTEPAGAPPEPAPTAGAAETRSTADEGVAALEAEPGSAGCASCAAGGPDEDGSSWLIALLVGLWLLRRRRGAG